MSAWRRVVAVVMALCIGATICLMPTRADIVFRGAGGGAGGGVSAGDNTTFTGNNTFSGTNLFTGRTTFGSAVDAANAVDFNETANCITFEGNVADAWEIRLCPANGIVNDRVVTIPEASATLAVSTAANIFTGAPQVFSAGAYIYSPVEAVTTTKLVTLNEGNETYTNTGDTDGATVTLTNDPTVGLLFNFAVTTAQTLTIVPSAGETLYFGSDQCLVSLSSNDVGATLTIRAVVGGSGGVWMSFGAQASSAVWDCNDV